MRRKEIDRIIAPVIGQTHAGQARFREEALDRQKLNSGDTDPLVMGYHVGVSDARKCPAYTFGHIRLELRQPFDMGFVEYGVGEGRFRARPARIIEYKK